MLGLAAILCSVPAQGVCAAAETIDMTYTGEKRERSNLSDEEYARLCSLTQGTTMTVDGTIADDVWNLDLDGSGSLYVTFENLPPESEGFSNLACFVVSFTFAEEDDSLSIFSYNFNDDYSSGRVWLATEEDEFDITVLHSEVLTASAGNLFLGTIQNGVTYDLSATINAFLAHASANPDAQEAFNHLKTSQVIEKEIFFGINYGAPDLYDGDLSSWGVTWRAQGPAVETTQEVDETTEETQESTETTVEESVVETTVEETEFVQPEITQGDLAYTVKAGDTLGSISAGSIPKFV